MFEAMYQAIGGDYQAARTLLLNDRLIARFVLKYPLDPTFAALQAAMQADDDDAAFAAAHTLKGLALSLAFARLADAAALLTEALRPQQRADCTAERRKALYEQVCAEQQKVLWAISSLEQQE